MTRQKTVTSNDTFGRESDFVERIKVMKKPSQITSINGGDDFPDIKREDIDDDVISMISKKIIYNT